MTEKKRELSSQSADGDDSKRPREESNKSTTTPTSPGDVFEESLKSGDSVKILVMQSIMYAKYTETSKKIISTSSTK